MPARTHPFSERTTVTGSVGISADSSIAFAALALDDRRAPGVAELLGVGHQLVAHLAAQPRLGAEDLRQRVALLDELGLLAADLHLLQAWRGGAA